MSPDQTGELFDTASLRAGRLDDLISEANEILDRALMFASEWEVTAVAGLFSGGNDSTVLAHLIRDRVTHYVHANTQVGAEPTRQFVRDVSAAWGIPLLEEKPPGYGYEDLVLKNCPAIRPERAKFEHIYQGGFPMSNDHRIMFGQLKGRALRLIQHRLAPSPRRQRVVYIDGRRAEESGRRKRLAKELRVTPWEIKGSQIAVSPLIGWSKLDLNEYRRRFPDVPRNETADLMHMSMECACGCYARRGEIEELEMWVPSLAEYLHQLEWRLAKLGLDIDPRRLVWGNEKEGRCASGLCNT